MIYLDNAATTFPKPEIVYDIMDMWNRKKAVNAGRGGYKLAREASSMIADTKNIIRSLVGADITVPVVFSPSITVAMNQIVNGLNFKKNSVIYVSPYEHNAVARTLKLLSLRQELVIKELPLDKNTLEIDIERMKYEFSKEKPDAVFTTHISNVTGYILPIKDIFDEAKKYDAITVLDTAQSLGLVEVNINKIQADIIAFAGHKTLYGPLGIGGFINASRIELKPFIVGGTGSDSLNLDMPTTAEGKYESASSNIIAIAGLNAAIKNINQDNILANEKELTKYLICKLKNIKGIEIFSQEESEKQVGIVSFMVKNMNSDDVGTILDEDFDIAVRTGYHCAPYIHKYLKDMDKLGTVRVGLGQFNTKNDIDSLIDALKEIVYE